MGPGDQHSYYNSCLLIILAFNGTLLLVVKLNKECHCCIFPRVSKISWRASSNIWKPGKLLSVCELEVAGML